MPDVSQTVWPTVDATDRVVRLVVRGQPSIPEIEATLSAVLHDPFYEPGFGFLVDRRDADAPWTGYVVQVIEFARRHVALLRRGRVAVVVADAANFGMVRMAQTLADTLPVPIELFTDVPAAEAWLRETATD